MEPLPLTTAAAGLVQSVDGLRSDLQALAKAASRSRRLIRWLAASVVFDVILSLCLGFGFYVVDKTADKADKASSSQVVTCRSSNATRLVQIQLWTYVLDQQAGRPDALSETERIARAKTIADFRVYLAKAFAPRDCNSL